MRILIATATAPKNFDAVCDLMRSAVAEKGHSIPPGILWVSGPGCSNLAFDFDGPDDMAEQFANELTMVLMPSKWCTTSDPLPDVDTCEVHAD